MELGVSHEQNLSSLTPNIDNIFDKYNKTFGTHKISFMTITIRQEAIISYILRKSSFVTLSPIF